MPGDLPGSTGLGRLRLSAEERGSPTAPAPKPRGRLIGIGALALITAAAAAFWRLSPSPAVNPVPVAAPVIAPPASAPPALAPGGLLAAGRIEAGERRALSAAVPGVVSKVHVSPGARVKAGDILVELEHAAEEADLALAEAAIAAAEARLQEVAEGARPEERESARMEAAAAEAQAMDAKQKADRDEKLLQQGAITAAQAEESRNAARSAEARFKASSARLSLLERGSRSTSRRQAEADLSRARADARRAKARIDQMLLRAPADAAILDVKARVGEAIEPDTPPIILGDLDHLRAVVDVPESRAALLADGDPAVVELDALPKLRLKGHVERIALEADRQKGALEVTVLIEQTDPRVRPRMGCRVTFESKEKP